MRQNRILQEDYFYKISTTLPTTLDSKQKYIQNISKIKKKWAIFQCREPCRALTHVRSIISKILLWYDSALSAMFHSELIYVQHSKNS